VEKSYLQVLLIHRFENRAYLMFKRVNLNSLIINWKEGLLACQILAKNKFGKEKKRKSKKTETFIKA